MFEYKTNEKARATPWFYKILIFVHDKKGF